MIVAVAVMGAERVISLRGVKIASENWPAEAFPPLRRASFCCLSVNRRRAGGHGRSHEGARTTATNTTRHDLWVIIYRLWKTIAVCRQLSGDGMFSKSWGVRAL